jgi:hypothetical protein
MSASLLLRRCGGAKYPDGGTLPAVEDFELHTGFIYYSTSYAIQRIDFSQHCALSDTPKTWIARTYANVVKFWGDECSLGAGPCSSSTRF